MAHPVFLNRRLWKWLLLIAIYFALTGSPIYYKPAYHGRVVDADTGEPIRGAIVTASYSAGYFIFIDLNQKSVKEDSVKTDEDGHFFFPFTLRLLGPFSWIGQVYFSVHRDGYVSLISSPIGDCLSKGCGTKKIPYVWDQFKIIVVSDNLIQIPKRNMQNAFKRNRCAYPEKTGERPGGLRPAPQQKRTDLLGPPRVYSG